MFLLTVRDVQYRALRFAISVVGTALVLAMVFLMTGLSAQFRNEPRATVDGFGAEAWVVADGATGPFTAGSPVPVTVAEEIDAGGAAVDPVLIGRHTLDRGGEVVDVVVVGYVDGGLGEPNVVVGERATGGGQVVADATAQLDIGDEAVVGESTYEVVGLTRGATLFAGIPLLSLPLEQAQQLIAQGQPIATAFLVDSAEVTPPAGFTTLSAEDVWTDALRPVARSTGAIDLVQILLWIVAATIIGAVVYLSALERRRDFAVLKAMGTTTRALALGLAAQSVLVALLAAALATGLQALLQPVFPLPVDVPAASFIQLPLLAIVVALIASIGGLRRAVAVDPALAFAGPGG